MNANINTIAQMLDRANIPYELDREKSLIYLVANFDIIGTKIIIIRVISNGGMLEIEAPGLFQVKDKVFKGIFMQNLLKLQCEMSLLKFYYYSLKDEEWIGMLLEHPFPITSEQLYFCLSLLLDKLKNCIPRLQHILTTGNELYQKYELEQLLDDMPPEAVEKLTQLLQQRKQK